MADKKKTSRWAKTLDEAGLLDEIEDGWNLPAGPVAGSTIEVESGFGEPAPGPAAHGEIELEEIPEEAPLELASEPPTAAPEEADAQRTPIKSWRSSAAPEPIPIASARETANGIPRVSSRPPAPAPSAPPPGAPADVRTVEVRGRRISVAPEPPGMGLNALVEPIYDDPPDADAEGLVSSVAPSERISEPAAAVLPTAEDAQRPVAAGGGLAAGPHQRLGELYDLGDFSGALAVAEEILRQVPDNTEAVRYRDSCREVLMQMYEARIGSCDRVPRLAVTEQDLLWRNLDATTGFVLSQIDGMSTFEDVIDVSGLPRFDTCRILDQLLQDGIIE